MTDESIADVGIESNDESTNDAVAEENVDVQTSEPEETEDNDVEASETEEPKEEVIEEEEFNFLGNKLKIPKGKIPEELSAKIKEFTEGTAADYTRKSQHNAEFLRNIEAREKAVKEIENVSPQVLKEFAKGEYLKSELEELEQIDITSLWQSEPDKARYLSDTIAQKRAVFQNVVANVDRLERQEAQAKQELAELNEKTRNAEFIKANNEGKKIITSSFKDFKENEVLDYAMQVASKYSKNVSKKDMENWGVNPFSAEVTYKAMKYDQLQAKLNNATNPPVKQATPMKSVVSKGSNTKKDPKDMTMKEYAEWRNKSQSNK